jgi:polyisoprenyl-teichoic acid--peptidoglycan teichoic acid transferase
MAASGEKPYRVYKGGRTKGKVPLPSRERDERRAQRGGDGGDIPRRPRRSWTWRRWTLVVVLVLIVLFVIWGAAGYLSVSSGVSDANKRLPPNTTAVLTKQNGLILDSPTDILLLGTDHATNGQAGRSSDDHSDSMMLLRLDPGRHRITYLSIPRDLGVTIDGVYQKINAAMQLGGPRLAVQTVDNLLGSALPVNHIVLVDFEQFQTLVDAVGGITVNVPEKILSNRFDCPYSTQARCQQWPGWRFAKGPQHMNGHTALIYSRIRENQLDPSWTDFQRQQDQQAVMQATLAKLSSPTRFFSLPFDGKDLLAPIATDLTTWDFLQLGWVKFRAGDVVHCRLGGSSDGGYITSTQENIQVIQEVLGNSAPQPPAPGTGLFGPGCVVGSQTFK